LLFGSRFHAIRQSRGQQGIGITGVVMYCQLTTGRTTHVRSKIATEPTAAVVDIGLDTRKNKAKRPMQGVKFGTTKTAVPKNTALKLQPK